MKMRKILTMLFALVSVVGQAQKQVVWEKPTAFMGNSNAEFEITKVELKQTETVLHINANYRPGSWIRFAKESFVQTPDGKKYAITGGASTNEKEFDIELDSLFWMPKSGVADLALHFKPVPLDTKEMDFLEGYNDNDFKFWNISNGKTKQKFELPDEWKDVQYDKDETLPAAKINQGVATIKVKMLGYKRGMNLDFYVGGFTPLGVRERFDKWFPFADDGTLKVEVPLWLAREVTVGVQGMAFSDIVIAPGEETSILMKVTADHRPFVAFKGYLAKTNMDLVTAEDVLETDRDDDDTYLKVKDCKTPAERLQCLTDIFNKRVATFQKTKYTTAAKDLLCMAAEENFVQWTRQFATIFSQYRIDEDGTVYMTSRDFEENYQKNKELLSLSEEESAYTWKYLNEPGSPCSSAFWDIPLVAYEEQLVERPNYNRDLQLVPMLLKKDDEQFVNRVLQTMKHEDCKAVVLEYQAEQQRIAQQLTSQESVFFQKYDDVAPENILQTILDKYKGKAVVIDIWATWCGPCRAGHQAMKPMKEEMKGKNIQFVYITSPTSPLNTWQEMIKEIDGDHYYLTKEQYSYILNKYESEGIPTYAIYDKNGNQTNKTIGFPGVETIREELEKVMK
jgi:thiol-disulfide isomerase/thioredoxin